MIDYRCIAIKNKQDIIDCCNDGYIIFQAPYYDPVHCGVYQVLVKYESSTIKHNDKFPDIAYT